MVEQRCSYMYAVLEHCADVVGGRIYVSAALRCIGVPGNSHEDVEVC